MKRIIALLLAVMMILSFAACGVTPVQTPAPTDTPAQTPALTATPTFTPTPADDTAGMSQQELDIGLKKYVPTVSHNGQPGLYVENGTVVREGKPYYSIGVNFYSFFISYFLEPLTGIGDIDSVFRLMKEHGIEYCRVSLCMYWPIYYKYKNENINDYYMFLDSAIKKAEEYEIGLICSMFFNYSGLSDYLDEPKNAWCDENSKTRQYMRDYTTLIVSRYKESPAIWGWEFGNEMNLAMDLPNAASFHGETDTQGMGTRPYRDENDDLYTEEFYPAIAEWATIVRELDPYGRMITTGNGEPRESQWNQYMYNSWTKDTQEQFGKILAIQTPDPCDTTSGHVYGLLERFEGSETYTGWLKAFKEESAKIGKAVFLGEFDGTERYAKQIIDAIVETEIQLSCLWVFGDVSGGDLRTKPELCSELLSYIEQANKKLAEIEK